MLSLQPPVVILVILATTLGLLVCLLVVRIMGMKVMGNDALEERYSKLLMFGLLILALLSIGVFVIYALFFVSH